MARQPKALAEVWKALADPTRRRILDLLRERPRTTGDLAGHFRLSRFAVMKHLDVLERSGLVLVERRGRERWNYLNAVPIRKIYERWVKRYEGRWASSLLGLKRRAEDSRGGEEAMPQTAAQGMGAIQVEQEVRIEAPPERVFDALTKDVAAWWGAPHMFDPQAHDIILEARLGGRFFEDWGDGEGVLWATVTGMKRGESLRLTGPIGMRGAVAGVVTFTLEAVGHATVLRLSHHAVGEVTPETEASYTKGWKALLAERLKVFIEHGEARGLRAGRG